jgi:serine protease Do
MIVGAEKKELKEMEELSKEVRGKKVGDKIDIIVMHGPMKREVDIKLAESPSQ